MTEQADDAPADGAVTQSRDGAVLRITFDRKARRNSLSHKMIDDIVGILTAAATDDSLRAISISGAGRDFCTGADWVATNSGGQRPRTGDLIRRIPHTANRAVELIASIHLPPVVCRVRGWAVGLTRAKRMLLLGEQVSGADAADWGLIHQAVGLAKQAIHKGLHATLTESMTQELASIELACRTTDFKEGLAAFREKRAPEFGGR